MKTSRPNKAPAPNRRLRFPLGSRAWFVHPPCAQSASPAAIQARQEGQSYELYLLSLVERECQERRNNRIERLLKQSRLPLEKCWPALEQKRLPAKWR